MIPALTDLAQPAARPERVRHIRILSRGLGYMCMCLAIVLPAGLLAYWLVTPDEAVLLGGRLPGIVVHPIGWSVRLGAMVISLVPLALLVWGLMRARQCFEIFALGRFFPFEAIHCLRDLAIAVFASTLLKPFAGAALSVLLSWQTYAGGKTLVFEVGSDFLLALLVAGLIAVIAWVMSEPAAIADENAQFI